MGGMIAGIMQGMGEASRTSNEKTMALELAARQGIASMWESIANNEGSPPEVRQAAMQNIMEIYQSDPTKPLNKKFTSIDQVARLHPVPPSGEAAQMAGQTALPAAARGNEPPTPPSGLLGIPSGVQRALPGGENAPVVPGGGSFGPPPSPEGLPPADIPESGPARDSVFYSPGEMSAMEMNRLQKMTRAGLLPQGYGRANTPFAIGAGGAGVMDMEGNVSTVPPAISPPRRTIQYQGQVLDADTMEPIHDFGQRPPRFSAQQQAIIDAYAEENGMDPQDPTTQDAALKDHALTIAPPTIIQTTDASGSPITRVVPRNQSLGEWPIAPGAAARMRMDELEAGLSNMGDLWELFDSSYVGPWAGPWQQFMMGTPQAVRGALEQVGVGPGKELSPAQAEFYAATASLNNEMIRLITGAQMSEVEAKRIMLELPGINNDPVVWKARFRSTQRNRQTLLDKIRGLSASEADQYKVGQAVWLDEEWWSVEGINADGSLELEAAQ